MWSVTDSHFGNLCPIRILVITAPPPPSAPIVTIGVQAETDVQILWSSSGEVTGFEISWLYVGPCANAPQVPEGSVQLSGSATNYTVTRLLPGSRYNMTIVATNEAGSAEEYAVLKTLPAGE